MPSDIIPDQSTNTNLMLDGQVLHGQAPTGTAGGTPYIKDIFEDIVTNVNTLASESNVTPGASKIGVKTDPFTNFNKSTNDVEACLEGIDASLSTAGGGIKAYQFYDKYLYNAKRNAVHQGVTTGTTVTVAELRAYLGVDAGYQIDSMSSTTGWSGSNGDSALALYTADYFEGGACIAVTKATNSFSSAGLEKTTFPATNLGGKKIRLSVKIPPVTGGSYTFTGVRVTLGDTAFAANGIWNITLDVGGQTLVANDNKYVLEIDADSPDISNSYSSAAVTCARIEMLVSNPNGLFANFLVDHLIYTPDTVELNVNVLVRKVSDGQWYLIKQTGDSYSFPSLTAGQMIIKNVAIENASLEDNDVLFIDIPDSSSYGGQDLFVMVKLL